jgi:hypothetical protein
MRFALLPLLSLLLASPWSVAVAQDTRSGNFMLPHCKAALAFDAQDPIGGRCMGIVATLSFVSRVLPDNLKFCHPNTATPEQLLQVVIGFAEANPDAIGQDFRLIALAAMHDKWPCQE